MCAVDSPIWRWLHVRLRLGRRMSPTRDSLARQLRLGAKASGQYDAIHGRLLEMAAQADALQGVAKRLLERLRDEWARDEGANMDWDDLDLEAETATLLGEGPR